MCYHRNLTDRDRFVDREPIGVYNHWQKSFRTDDAAVAAQRARSQRLAVEWGEDDTMLTRYYCAAFEYDPNTDRNVLYSSLADHGMWFDTWPLVSHLPYRERPLHMTFGDDTEFTDDERRQWIDLYDRYGTPIRWRRGDVGVICNYRFAHGRPGIHLGDGGSAHARRDPRRDVHEGGYPTDRVVLTGLEPGPLEPGPLEPGPLEPGPLEPGPLEPGEERSDVAAEVGDRVATLLNDHGRQPERSDPRGDRREVISADGERAERIPLYVSTPNDTTNASAPAAVIRSRPMASASRYPSTVVPSASGRFRFQPSPGPSPTSSAWPANHGNSKTGSAWSETNSTSLRASKIDWVPLPWW